MRCGLPSAARRVEASAIDIKAIAARPRRKPCIPKLLTCVPSLRGAMRRSNPVTGSAVWALDCFASLAMTLILLRANQCIAVFGERQNLPDADLNRGRDRNEVRPLAGLALDGIH